MSLAAFAPRPWDVPDLVKAGFSSAISSTWGSPMIKYGIVGTTVAGIGIAAIAAGLETVDGKAGLPSYSLIPNFTKNIRDTAIAASNKINFLSKATGLRMDTAILAANIYNYVFLDSPATPIIEAAIPAVERARTLVFTGMILTAFTISSIANARISEAINRIPVEDRNPISVGQTTMKAVMQSVAQSVKSVALWGAIWGVAKEGFQKGGRRFMFGNE
jgi:hypothetical protein